MRERKNENEIIIVFFSINLIYFEILKTVYINPSKSNFSSVCPFNHQIEQKTLILRNQEIKGLKLSPKHSFQNVGTRYL